MIFHIVDFVVASMVVFGAIMIMLVIFSIIIEIATGIFDVVIEFVKELIILMVYIKKNIKLRNR